MGGLWSYFINTQGLKEHIQDKELLLLIHVMEQIKSNLYECVLSVLLIEYTDSLIVIGNVLFIIFLLQNLRMTVFLTIFLEW